MAVSLRLFGSRCEELRARSGGGIWAALPASVAAAASAALAYAELHRPASAAAAAAATAHRRAAECKASVPDPYGVCHEQPFCRLTRLSNGLSEPWT